MNCKKQILCFISIFIFFKIPGFAQVTGGFNSGQTTPKAPSVNSITQGPANGSVNLFNGNYQTAIPLGSVSTPYGLSYSLNLSYQSTAIDGDNPSLLSGIPYGEGWNIDIPTVSIDIAAYHKYALYLREKNGNCEEEINLTYQNGEYGKEGALSYFSPTLSIPGVANGRLIYKGIYNHLVHNYRDSRINEGALIFVLHEFSSVYVEVIYNEDNNGGSWTVILPNGITYYFNTKVYEVINANNLRIGNADWSSNSVAVGDFQSQMEPQKVVNKWLLTRISNPSVNLNQCIQFDYSEYGKFNFHKEYDNDFYICSKDIFLQRVTAGYFTEIESLIAFEKLELTYKEKPGLAALKSDLITSLTSGAERIDDLYYKKTIKSFDASNIGSTFKHFKTWRSLSNGGGTEILATNPYVKWLNGAGTYKLKKNSLNYFDHGFYESPRILLSELPPGDLYKVNFDVFSNAKFCNYDINVMGAFNEYTSLPQNEGDELDVSQVTYDQNHSNTLYSTFGNIIKYNTACMRSGGLQTFSGLFTMPNLYMCNQGLFLQIGPGNSDNDFSIPGTNVFTDSINLYNTNDELRTKSTYFNDPWYFGDQSQNNSTCSYFNNKTLGIPYNFGGGYPWYITTGMISLIHSSFPVNHSLDVLCDIYKNWPYGTNTEATLSDASAGLRTVSIERYSKVPYVLESVTRYVLNAQTANSNSVQQQSFVKDGVVELTYDIQDLDVYPSLITTYNLSNLTPTHLRHAIVLTGVTQKAGDGLQSNSTLFSNTFDYTKVQPPKTEKIILSQSGINVKAYYGGSEILLLNKIKDNVGKEISITYNTSPESYNLGEITYNYNPEYFGQGGSLKTQLNYGAVPHIWAGPQVNTFLSYRVNKVSIAVAANVMDELTYNYLNPISNVPVYFPLDNPAIIHSDIDRAYTVHKSNNISLGFERVMETRKTERTTYYYLSTGGKDVTGEVYDDRHLFGLLYKVETTKNNVLLNVTEYSYKVTKAFESGLTRGLDYSPNAESPSYCNAMQNCDYGDYFNSTSICSLNTYQVDYWGHFAQRVLKNFSALADVSEYSPSNTPYSHYYRIQVAKDKQINLPFLESYKSNATLINQYYKDYLQSFFIEKSKEITTSYNPKQSASYKISKTTEYSYYSANYKGLTTCAGYGYILDAPVSPVGTQLLYEPSWQLYSTTSYSSELPGIRSTHENFYYYDLVQIHNVYSTINYEPSTFNGTFPPCAYPYNPIYLVSRIHSITQNGLEALTYAYFWGKRDLLFETRKNNTKNAYAPLTGDINTELYRKSTYFIAKKTPGNEYTLNTPFYTLGYYTPTSGTGGSGGGGSPPPGDGTSGGGKTNTTDPLGTGDGSTGTGTGTGTVNPPPVGSGDGGTSDSGTSTGISPTLQSNGSGDPANNVPRFANVNLDGQNLSNPIVIQPKEIDIPSPDPRHYKGEPVQGLFVPLNMVVVQTTDIPNPLFTSLFPNALQSPILHFRQYAQYDPNAFVDPTFEYKPIFPFDTLSLIRNHQFNKFARPSLVSNERGLCSTFNTDFSSYRVYENSTTLSALDEHWAMTNVGMLKSTTTGTLFNSSYAYYPNNDLKSITDENNVLMEFAYDEAGRLKNTKRNATLLNEYNYSTWNYSSSASSYDAISKLNYVTTTSYIDNDKAIVSRGYADPLGNPYQSVSQTRNGTTYGNSIILSGKQELDAWFRPVKQYKNFVKLITDGAEHLDADMANSTATYYTSVEYDDDYLGSQVKAQADYSLSIGGGHDKTISTDVILGDELVTELGLNAFAANAIMSLPNKHTYVFNKTTASDEDQKTSVVYTDPLGRKVAQVGFVDLLKTQKAITLFSYNAQGLLQRVINPLGQETFTTYNKLGWVTSTTNPDEGETRFMYDYSGKPVLTQTEKQRSLNNFDRYEYDIYGRLLGKDITEQVAPKVYLNALSDLESYSWMDNKLIYNTSNMQIVHKQKRMYYDVIPANNTNGLIYHDYIQNYMLYAGSTLHQSKNGKPSLTASYTNDHLTSINVFLYNELGQLLQQAQQFNPLGIGNSDNKDIFYCIEYEKYGLTGNIITKNIRKAFTTGTSCNTVIPIRQYHYVYDDWNRLKEIYFNETNDKANGRKVVEYAYDDATGHITEKKHFSYEGQISKNLDTKIDLRYNYDDRLRLTQINSELFNTQLYYDASTMQFGTGNIAYSNNYNGNMNGAESYLKTSNLSNPIGAKGGYLFAGHLLYGYKYDGLNRLTLADGFDYDNVMASVSGDIDHAGDEEMTYDAIGNVLSLDRYWDPTGMATDPGKDAHYGYNYAVGNNQLLAVQNTTFTPGGASSITTQNFSYDANGNVLTDSKRNIAFTYTNGNLPESVKLQTNISGSNKSIRYHYDGSDRRISKERNDNGTLTTDFYLMDAGGSLIALVDYNTFDEKEWYINGEAKAVKRIIPAYGTQPYEIPVFYITDQHQNTRVTYSASPADISAHHFTLETATDYYAFGKVLRQYKNTGCDEKYGFQGSELEDETEDFYYTQYRHLDVDVARWWGVDPMAYHPQQLRFSPYVFSNNNPLRFTDPDGRLPLDWVKLQNGGVVFDANVNSQAQATTKYGNGAFDIGKSGVYMNGQGQQVNLNTDGTATSLTMLSEVTVTGKSGSSLIGTLDNLTDAVDLSNNLNIGAIAGASKLGNALDAATSVINVLDNVGKGLGITGAVISTAQAIENPTAGNILKAGVDISLAALKVNPLTGAAIGIVDGLLSVTGAKDAIFKALDNEVDEYQSNKEIESRQVDISKIRIR